MGIEKKRKEIDEVDREILSLLNKRAKAVKEIASEKQKDGKAVYVPERERALLQSLIKENKGPMESNAVESIYRSIISECRALESRLKIAYLGPVATFTHMAAIKNFGESTELISQKSIADVFSTVEKGSANYGVVPVENSTEGAVNHTLDRFMDSDLCIVAEIVQDINHCLLSNTKLNEIKKVYSQPSALAQCRNWLMKNIPNAEQIESSSTAKAAELASVEQDSAAIASELASKEYGISIAAKNIQDLAHNATRFLVIGKNMSGKAAKNKTSIMFSVKHEPGSLLKSLQSFANNKINMTKIESRPTKKKGWEVIFFVDLEGHIEDSNVKNALDGLKKSCLFVKVLGSYPLEVSVSE